MAKVVLHIGTHKTATTTIQNTFHANRGLLARHGLKYPDIGRTQGHHGLVMKWITLPDIFAIHGGPDAAWARIAGLAAKDDATVFISSEEFSRGHPKPRVNFREVRKLLSGFDQIEVICTLRDQVSYLQSIYLEVSKRQAPAPWATFLTNALASDFATGLFLDCNRLNDHLLDAFAPSEIRYIDFATATAREGGIVRHFLDLLKIDLGKDRLCTVNEGAANVSPAPLASWAASQIAAPYPASTGLVAMADAALREELGETIKTTLYTRAEEMRVLTRYAPLNARFVETISPSNPGFAITAKATRQAKVYREDISQKFWLRVARRLHTAA
jgi:hypothetical protein